MSSTGVWVKKFWYVHTIDNYSATIRNEIFIQTRMNQKKIMVSKKIRQKVYTVRFKLHRILENTN